MGVGANLQEEEVKGAKDLLAELTAEGVRDGDILGLQLILAKGIDANVPNEIIQVARDALQSSDFAESALRAAHTSQIEVAQANNLPPQFLQPLFLVCIGA